MIPGASRAPATRRAFPARTLALTSVLALAAAVGGACGGGDKSPTTPTGSATYELLYVDDALLPANIASAVGFSEDLASGKIVLDNGKALVIQTLNESGTAAAPDTASFTYRRSGDKLILTSATDATVVDTLTVDSALAPDLYLRWSTTIVGRRGSRSGNLTYIKRS